MRAIRLPLPVLGASYMTPAEVQFVAMLTGSFVIACVVSSALTFIVLRSRKR